MKRRAPSMIKLARSGERSAGNLLGIQPKRAKKGAVLSLWQSSGNSFRREVVPITRKVLQIPRKIGNLLRKNHLQLRRQRHAGWLVVDAAGFSLSLTSQQLSDEFGWWVWWGKFWFLTVTRFYQLFCVNNWIKIDEWITRTTSVSKSKNNNKKKKGRSWGGVATSPWTHQFNQNPKSKWQKEVGRILYLVKAINIRKRIN